MATPSPLLTSGALTTFEIKVEGTAIPSTFQVYSIDTWLSVNRLPKARLVIFDGSPATGDFPISNLATFLPGKNVTIAAGYDENQTLIFTGVVVSQGIEINQSKSSKLIVDLTDKAMVMTLDRKNAVFANTKDSDLIQTLISTNGLSGTVSSTTTVYEDIVQYYSTDWDLMVMRAELNGFVVITDGGQITVQAPNTQADPVLEVEYGDSILDLEAQMNAATQYKSTAIKSYAWDEATQAMLESGPGSLSVTEPGNVSSETLAATFNVSTYTQQTGGMIPSTALQDWSTAELLKSKLSKIRGQVRYQGSALAKPGSMIQLAGLGDRFNGAAFVSAIHHSICDGMWSSTATFGLAWPWFASEAPNIPAPGASGQLPPMQGLQTGIVQQVATDPDGEFRVQVTFPILGASSTGLWARLSSFYASNGFGSVFYPEKNDEVIVAFMNDDPRFPIILGSVYSKTLPPPYPPDADNNTKAIMTRSKLEVNFDDKNKIIKITTPKSRTITLDDTAGKITISDPDNNTITMSSSGITIDSGKDLVLKAAAGVTITAGTGLTMSASTDATLKGLNVSLTASAELKASGATAAVSGTAETAISGAIVKIN